jgi:hypothetical protein
MGATCQQNEPLDQFVDRQVQLYRLPFPTSPCPLAVGKYSDLADFTATASIAMSLGRTHQEERFGTLTDVGL